ncbi:MAG TPA: UDP-N-acetylmuramate dehydrogenase [Bacilli bacterium]|nr:UDP-N-acetylmuramate dehydrogenase [Bacilli bacterium]
MNIKEIKKLKVGKIIENIDLKEYTTYKAGGKGRLLVIPSSVEQLMRLIDYIKTNNIKYKVLGNGSNLLFSDELYDGILIKLDSFNDIDITGKEIRVGAGFSLIKLALIAARNGLTGLEFASGIPGTVGGAIYMNAGAYKSDMGYIVKSVKVLTPNFEIKELSNKQMNYHYRTSFLQNNPGYICLETTLKLQYGNKETILAVIRDRKKRRLESQPLEFPSAGSVFRNPTDMYAGKLIEDLGYKGKKIGNAMVSEKHANFIINTGNAKANDIRKLILEIRDKVKEKYDIELKIEQEFVD